MSNQLFDAYFTAPAMRAIYSDHGRVQGMLDFEAALARAGASSGLIPQAAVAPIASACQAERYDFAALAQAIVTAGNSAIPLVKALGKQVAAQSAEAERYVHLGATSQNAMDSGLVLQLRAAITLLEQDLAQLATALARELDLQLPEQPWHTQRDRLVEFASLLGLLGLIAGSLGKFGRDLSLLMQTEAGEVF